MFLGRAAVEKQLAMVAPCILPVEMRKHNKPSEPTESSSCKMLLFNEITPDHLLHGAGSLLRETDSLPNRIPFVQNWEVQENDELQTAGRSVLTVSC